MALGLLVAAAGPAIGFGIGGVPHTARAGLAAGGLSSLATVATKLLAGVQPYSASFHGAVPFIYPPGTLAFLPIPLLAGVHHYVLAFALEMLVVVLVGVPLATRGSGRRGLSWAVLGALAAAGPLTLFRNDPAIGLLLLAAALAFSSGRPGAAFLLVFAAGLIKEYALVELVPLAGLQMGVVMRAAGPWRARVGSWVRPVLVGLLPTLAVLVAVEIWSGGGLLSSQLHNLERGVEIESVPAALAMLLAGFKGIVVTRGVLGSMQISGADLHLRLISALCAAVGVALLLLIAWRAFRGGTPAGVLFSASLGVALLATPVLSPQYLDALTPCLCLAAYEVGGGMRPILLWGAIDLAALTQLEFPYLWTSVLALARSGLIPLELRNLSLLLVVGALLWITMRARRVARDGHPRPPVPTAPSPAAP